MYCRQCGQLNPDTATTCFSCGAPLVSPTNPYQAPGQLQGAMPGAKPNNYLVQSILVTLCCCLPLGIVAIVYAAQVDSKWNLGDYAGAHEAANNAYKWSLVAFLAGLVATAIWIAVQMVFVVGAAV